MWTAAFECLGRLFQRKRHSLGNVFYVDRLYSVIPRPNIGKIGSRRSSVMTVVRNVSSGPNITAGRMRTASGNSAPHRQLAFATLSDVERLGSDVSTIPDKCQPLDAPISFHEQRRVRRHQHAPVKCLGAALNV